MPLHLIECHIQLITVSRTKQKCLMKESIRVDSQQIMLKSLCVFKKKQNIMVRSLIPTETKTMLKTKKRGDFFHLLTPQTQNFQIRLKGNRGYK